MTHETFRRKNLSLRETRRHFPALLTFMIIYANWQMAPASSHHLARWQHLTGVFGRSYCLGRICPFAPHHLARWQHLMCVLGEAILLAVCAISFHFSHTLLSLLCTFNFLHFMFSHMYRTRWICINHITNQHIDSELMGTIQKFTLFKHIYM